MKAYVIQPPYSLDKKFSDEYFDFKIKKLSECDIDADIIVLPEYSDVPCAAASLEETLFYHKKYIAPLLEKCVETAKRCNALVFVNALSEEGGKYRNTTYCFNRKGEIAGKYFKKHLPPLELETLGLDSCYTFEASEPYIFEADGLKFAFMTCYDFYFYEAFSNIARYDPDIIIGCSLQRSDTHEAIEIMSRFLAYNTNAYVIRSSVTFGEDSPVCGSSMIVSPKGEVLLDMRSSAGIGQAEFDPSDKYYKPAGFGNPPSSHHKYIEYGRKPMQYRPAGSAIIKNDKYLPYPRICAHRGFNTIAPENSMPAFGAAVAMGAEEIEFDLWPTADGEIVSCHDDTLDRVSNGTGKIYEHTLPELMKLDFGIRFGEKFKGMKILLFEDILKKFSCHVIMNIHIKTLSDRYDENIMKKIVSLIRKYDCEKYVYFMISHDGVIEQFKKYAPDINICVGHLDERPWEIVERAIEHKAYKVQLFKPFFNAETVKKAHENGILCNVFYADDPDEAKKYIKMGIDTVLTNDYNLIKQALDM